LYLHVSQFSRPILPFNFLPWSAASASDQPIPGVLKSSHPEISKHHTTDPAIITTTATAAATATIPTTASTTTAVSCEVVAVVAAMVVVVVAEDLDGVGPIWESDVWQFDISVCHSMLLHKPDGVQQLLGDKRCWQLTQRPVLLVVVWI
jgi:hypothetical protein